MEYTREDLLKICEQAFVPQELWRDRDSAESQMLLGKAYALLKAGCYFEVTYKGSSCVTDERTIWVQFWVHDFMYFEGSDDNPNGNADYDYHFYLPTQKRLDEAKGGDWY